MTFHLNIGFVDYMEYGLHRFVVGDALGVSAANDSVYGVGQRYLAFLGHLVVSDNIDLGFRGDQRDFI